MCAVIPYPGFKSLSLRHNKSSAYALLFYYLKRRGDILVSPLFIRLPCITLLYPFLYYILQANNLLLKYKRAIPMQRE